MTTRHHSILGIDVGKDALHVGFIPEAAHLPPKSWNSVVALSYKNPRWWLDLLDLIDEHATVAAEPTGHHLLAPVANVLYTYKPAVALWQVDHRLAEHYRAAHVSAAKNDRLDAIALTLIARDIAAGQPPRSCRPYDHFLESAVQRLRMLVNTHMRLTKENTRSKNRLNVLAHSLFPAFAGSDTWARAVRHGAISPAQIKALAALETPSGDYTSGQARRYLKAIAADLPDVEADPSTVAAVLDEAERQRFTDGQLLTLASQIKQVIESPTFALVTHRWRTIPGNSDIAIAALHVATLGRATELTKNEFRAAVGSSPRTSTSGSIDKTTKPRSGYQPVRILLHLWTLNLVGSSASRSPVNAYYRAGEGRSFSAAKNKFARVLWGTARNPKLDAAEEAGELLPEQ